MSIALEGWLAHHITFDMITLARSVWLVQEALAFFSSYLTNTLNATTATPDSFVMRELFPAPMSSSDAIAISSKP